MGEEDPKSGPIFDPFLEAHFGSQNCSKIGPKFVNFLGPFLDPFFGGFGALWVPLGSLLGPLEALLGGLKSEKMQTISRENHFFENVALLVFEALDGPLGLILLLLGQIWLQHGVPKWVAKFCLNTF